jgi:tetratricopeptide (TPR) repeat protein
LVAERAGSWSNARGIALELVRRSGGARPEYWRLLGFAHERLGLDRKAIIAYERAILCPGISASEECAVRLALARMHNQSRPVRFGQEAALVSVSRAVQLRPNCVAAHNLRALILSNLQRPRAALRERSQVVALRPQDPLSYLHRAIQHSKMDEPVLAVADLDRVWQLRQQRPTVAELRAKVIVLIALEEYEPALICVNQLLRKLPNDEDALFRRACLLEWLDRLPSALLALTDCLSHLRIQGFALAKRMRINERLFNRDGDPRHLEDALDDAAALERLHQPVHASILDKIRHLIQLANQPI